MPPIEEPTLGEVLRRLDLVVSQLNEIASELKADRAENAKTYVRQDVYMAQRQADAAIVHDLNGDIRKVETKAGERIDKLESDRQSDIDKRRQMWLAIAGMTLAFISATAALIVNIVQG